MPSLLPWGVIFALLALRINQRPDAWYVIVAVLAILGLQSSRNWWLGGMGGPQLDIFFGQAKVMSFALAATWLLLPKLKADNRFVAFLKSVPVLWLAGAAGIFGEYGGADAGEMTALVVGTALLGIGLPLPLMLAGRCCRRRYSNWRFLAWAVLWSIAAALAALLPVVVFAWLIEQRPPLLAFLTAIGLCSGLIFGLLLPFILLSFLNPFYGLRLKEWLLVDQINSPPVATPAQATSTAA